MDLATAYPEVIDDPIHWAKDNVWHSPVPRARVAKPALVEDKILKSTRIRSRTAAFRTVRCNQSGLASQKAIAKSLIKLNLNTGNAADLAGVTGVNAATLIAIATSIAAGTPLTAAQNDVYARFDLIITALLDETYQRSDNVYRNWTRALAALIAIALALVGGYSLNPPLELWQSVLVGLLATPLAPIAKDVSTALATAVNTMQLVKK